MTTTTAISSFIRMHKLSPFVVYRENSRKITSSFLNLLNCFWNRSVVPLVVTTRMKPCVAMPCFQPIRCIIWSRNGIHAFKMPCRISTTRSRSRISLHPCPAKDTCRPRLRPRPSRWPPHGVRTARQRRPLPSLSFPSRVSISNRVFKVSIFDGLSRMPLPNIYLPMWTIVSVSTILVLHSMFDSLELLYLNFFPPSRLLASFFGKK
jgi:hypothetical protein